MFNPLTRTLKLGLTAITILTAGGFAGTAFAEEVASATVADWINASDATASPDTDNQRNQFLTDTSHRGNVRVPDLFNNLSLNLGTSLFNNAELGGDSNDGVSYFAGTISDTRRWFDYAGIFSTTNLGKPLANDVGKASWVGRFASIDYARVDTEFILEVDFANRNLQAFVPVGHGWHLKLNAGYSDTGLIKGNIEYSHFFNNDRHDRNILHREGTVHGLIGQDGAVGAFISEEYKDAGFAGGFVARPANDGSDQTFFDDTCNTTSANFDPFLSTNVNKEFCYVEFEKKRLERVAFCDNPNNAGNADCMKGKLVKVCNYDPFAAICFNGNDYKEARKVKLNFCRENPADQSCNSAKTNPNVLAWEKSFVTKSSPAGLPSVADTATRRQFLKGRKTDLNETGITNVKARGALHFETAPVEDTPLSLLLATNPEPTLDTEIAKEGVAFFWGWERSKYAFYAGILEGTDLGTPVKSVSGTKATWNGKFQSLWFTTETDFELKIVFGDDNNGTINARIANNGDKTFFSHFFIDGEFDNNGLITGNILAGTFTDGNSENPVGTTYPGILRGLIGEEGAVGAFVGGTSTDEGNTITGTSLYSGGFIATPPPVVDYADWMADAEPTDTPTANRFFAGTPDLIFRENGRANNGITLGRFSGRESELSLPRGTGDIKNGFFIYTPTDGNNYAGLLPTTNLGAPLDATTAVGVWRGFFEQQTGNEPLNSTTFTLTVNFGAGASSTQAGTISGNGEGTNSAYAFTNVPFSTMGVIDGLITYTNPTDAVVSNGVITGLIGVKGAVGVFHSNVNAPTSYIGGFLAHKAPQ